MDELLISKYSIFIYPLYLLFKMDRRDSMYYLWSFSLEILRFEGKKRKLPMIYLLFSQAKLTTKWTLELTL